MPKSLPEVRGHWLLGSAREVMRSPHRFMTDAAAAHGGIAQFRILRRRVVVVSDPELAQQVLVSRWMRYQRGVQYRNLGIIAGQGLLSTDGAPWLKRRRQIQSAFRQERFAQLVPVAYSCAEKMLEGWERERAAGRSIAVQDAMLRLTMAAMGRMLLSADIPPEAADRIGEMLREGLRLVARRNLSVAPLPMWVPTSGNRRLLGYRADITGFVEEHVRRREPSSEPQADMLDALLDLRDPETGEALTHGQLIDETKTLFLAGFETTATALIWALFLVARHPHVLAALQAEVDEVLAGGPPDWAGLARLRYTAQILYETMRLYPPVYTIARVCVEDDELGGYSISKGTPVLVSVFGAHRSPAWGGDAAEFRPERFARGSEWPKRAYMPFAAGRHLCIGNDFSMVEMTVVLAAIAQRFRFRTSCETPIGERGRITLVPDREIRLELEPR